MDSSDRRAARRRNSKNRGRKQAVEAQSCAETIAPSTGDDANIQEKIDKTGEEPSCGDGEKCEEEAYGSSDKTSHMEQQASEKKETFKSEESNEDSEPAMPRLRQRRDRRAVRRSKSTMEWSPRPPASTKAKLSSQSLNMPRVPDNNLPVLQQSTSSCSDW